MADVLDRLAANNDPGNDPPARRTVVTVAMVRSLASESFAGWLGERANRRLVAHRFEACGYTPVRNPDRDTGLWVINGQRQVVYGLASLDRRTLIDEVRKLQTRGGQ
jgi:hypothetical protein